MEPYEFRRRGDGSIDFDFYRTGAAALRAQAMRDRATWRLAWRTVLLTAAGALRRDGPRLRNCTGAGRSSRHRVEAREPDRSDVHFAAAAAVLLNVPSNAVGTALALTTQASEQAARSDPQATKAAIAALTAKFGNRLVTSQAVREQHANTTTWIENQPPDAVVFPQATADVQDVGAHLRRPPRAGDRVRHRHLARRPRQRALWRRLDRLPRHEPRAGGALAGPRLRGRARHHPQAAQRASARPGPVLSDRSGRRRLARRHGGDALLRHQRGALRHHEGQRAGARRSCCRTAS